MKSWSEDSPSRSWSVLSSSGTKRLYTAIWSLKTSCWRSTTNQASRSSISVLVASKRKLCTLIYSHDTTARLRSHLAFLTITASIFGALAAFWPNFTQVFQSFQGKISMSKWSTWPIRWACLRVLSWLLEAGSQSSSMRWITFCLRWSFWPQLLKCSASQWGNESTMKTSFPSLSSSWNGTRLNESLLFRHSPTAGSEKAYPKNWRPNLPSAMKSYESKTQQSKAVNKPTARRREAPQ